jgi:hypothetical protein
MENDLRVAVRNKPHQRLLYMNRLDQVVLLHNICGTTKKSFISIFGEDILSLLMEIHPQPLVFNKVLCSSTILNEYMVETLKEAALEVGTDITDKDIMAAGKVFDPALDPNTTSQDEAEAFTKTEDVQKEKPEKAIRLIGVCFVPPILLPVFLDIEEQGNIG